MILQMMEIVGRASAARKSLGKKPFLYTVILTKTDKATEKGLHKTERDVRLGTRDLALILKATKEEEEGEEDEGEEEEGNEENEVSSKVNEEKKKENYVEKEEIVLSEEEIKSNKQKLNRELHSLVPILKTSSFSRVGRDDVWKLLQTVIGH
jgi:TATA-binding protein-associated factor Taf7